VGELRKRMHLFLNEKEMYVVCRTLDGVSQTDISIELKLSRMRISQLMASAFRKIRNSPIGSRLKEYIK
jgi:DNA-binding CsgD family transcriptional regulator